MVNDSVLQQCLPQDNSLLHLLHLLPHHQPLDELLAGEALGVSLQPLLVVLRHVVSRDAVVDLLPLAQDHVAGVAGSACLLSCTAKQGNMEDSVKSSEQ